MSASQEARIVNLTKDNFNEVVADGATVLIDFWAAWCGPCRMFAPTFEAASMEHTNVVFAKVNTEEEQELAGYFGIRSIPTIMAIRDRVGVFQQAGALPRAALDEIISKVQELDMEEVRRQIQESQSEA